MERKQVHTVMLFPSPSTPFLHRGTLAHTHPALGAPMLPSTLQLTAEVSYNLTRNTHSETLKAPRVGTAPKTQEEAGIPGGREGGSPTPHTRHLHLKVPGGLQGGRAAGIKSRPGALERTSPNVTLQAVTGTLDKKYLGAVWGMQCVFLQGLP